jgi:hypothetical protein
VMRIGVTRCCCSSFFSFISHVSSCHCYYDVDDHINWAASKQLDLMVRTMPVASVILVV